MSQRSQRSQEERLYALAERAQADGCATPGEISAWMRGRRIRHQGGAVTPETVSRILAQYTRSGRMTGGSRIVVRRSQP